MIGLLYIVRPHTRILFLWPTDNLGPRYAAKRETRRSHKYNFKSFFVRRHPQLRKINIRSTGMGVSHKSLYWRGGGAQFSHGTAIFRKGWYFPYGKQVCVRREKREITTRRGFKNTQRAHRKLETHHRRQKPSVVCAVVARGAHTVSPQFLK